MDRQMKAIVLPRWEWSYLCFNLKLRHLILIKPLKKKVEYITPNQVLGLLLDHFLPTVYLVLY